MLASSVREIFFISPLIVALVHHCWLYFHVQWCMIAAITQRVNKYFETWPVVLGGYFLGDSYEPHF